MAQSSSFEKNLTQGSVAGNLLRFALPFLLSCMVQALYNTVDMIVVGRFAGAIALSGVNIGAQVSNVITCLVTGLCVGGTVLIAQYLTSGREKNLRDTVATLFTALLLISVLMTALCLLVRHPMISLFTSDPEVYRHALGYYTATSAGIIFIFAYNSLAAVMRGMGESRLPMIFIVCACAFNICLDLLFVGVFGMGAAGAGVATVIAQAFSVVLCIVYLKTHDFPFDFKPSSFRINRHQLKMLFRIGLPASVQDVATGMSFLFITALANDISPISGSAIGVVSNLNGFAILPALAFSSSISSVAAQNIGAGRMDRAKKTMYIGFGLTMALSLAVFTVFQLMPETLLGLFVSSADENAAAMLAEGKAYISTYSIDFLLVPLLFSLNGLFIGAGHTMFSLINNTVAAVVLRVPLSYIGRGLLESEMAGVGLGAPVATVVSLVMCVIYYLSGRWQSSSILKDKTDL